MEPLVMVAGIIENNSQILVLKRKLGPFEGRFMLPSGYVEWNEHTVQAVQRIVKEQTGLDFTPKFLFYKDAIIRPQNIHAVFLVFAGKASGTFTSNKEDEKWLSEDMAARTHLAFNHQEILQEYFKQQTP